MDDAAWVSHFEANRDRNRDVDAQIDWRCGDRIAAGREHDAVLRSIQRFELGESGDGAVLLANARQAHPTYQRALRLFVQEEGEHARLLGQCLRRYGVPPLAAQWSDTAFVRVRRLLRLRWELMVLLCAEVTALSYYAALAACGDSAIRAMSERILDDERAHVRFHVQRLAAALPRLPVRACERAAWTPAMTATIVVVVWDHGGALRACGSSRRRFARSAWRDFRGVRDSVRAGGRDSARRDGAVLL